MSLFYLPRAQGFDTNGLLMSGAKLNFYSAGTSSPKNTYSDSDLTTANANPVVANASGLFGPIYLGAGGYKVVLTDADDVELWSQDEVSLDLSAVTYNQGGTGAVDRTAESKLREYPTPEDYGATGDGVADDTAEIQAAIDANSVVKCVPGSTYLISSTITIPANRVLDLTGCTVSFTAAIYAFTADGSNITIRGGKIAGPAGTYTAGQGGIDFTGTVNGPAVAPTNLENIIIEDVWIDRVGDYGIKVWYCDQVRVINVRMTNIGYFGLSFLSSSNCYAHNVSVDTVAGAAATSYNAYGIACSSVDNADTVRYPACTEITVNSCYVLNIPEWHGIMAKGGNFIRFTNNSVVNCMRGILFSYSGATGQIPTSDSVISHNVIMNYFAITDNSGGLSKQQEGIWDIGYSTSVQNTRNQIEHNTLYKHGGADADSGAVFIEYAKNGVVAHNSIVEPYRSGIVVTQGVDNYVIDNNTIVDPHGGGTGATPAQGGDTQFGLWFRDSDFDNITVSNNAFIVRDATIDTYVMSLGVYIPDTASKSIHFMGNRFDGLTTNIDIAGDATGLTGELYAAFTGTLTGYASPPTGSVKASVSGNLVTLHIPAISGTSNAAGLTMTGLPAWTTPQTDRVCYMAGTENSGAVLIVATINSGSATITFGHSTANNTTFTASGTKGVIASTITYSLKDN